MGIVEAIRALKEAFSTQGITLYEVERDDFIGVRGNYIVFERRDVSLKGRADLVFGIYVVTNSINQKSGAFNTLDLITKAIYPIRRLGLNVSVGDTSLLKADGSMFVYRTELKIVDL